MRLNKSIVVLAMFLCFVCVGCGKEKSEGNNTITEKNGIVDSKTISADDTGIEDGAKSIEFPKEYKLETDNVKFDTEVIVSDEVTKNGMSVITASQQRIDAEKAYETLMGNTEIRDKGENDTQLWYEGVNNEILTITPYSLGYSTKFFAYVSNAFRLQQGFSDYNAYKYSTEDELSFATREQAFEIIKSTLGTIGIDIDEQNSCFTLDHKIMQEEEYVTNIDGNVATEYYKDNWTEDDDSYYFIINQSYEETPTYHVFYEAFPLAADENAPIQVVYNKNGIQFLQIEKVFEFSEGNGVYDLKSFSEIAQVLQNKYGMLLGNSTYEVNSAKLYYMENKVAENQYEILPVWIFRTTESSTGKILQDVVNAQTAEEIIWEEK